MKKSIIKKYFLGEATEDEIESIFKWIEASPENKKEFIQYKKAWVLAVEFDDDYALAWQKVQKSIRVYKNKKRISLTFRYAAILVIVISVIPIWIINQKEVKLPENEIVLELSDGTKKVIYNDIDQDIINRNGTTLGKQRANKITYLDADNSNKGGDLVYNTLYVPYGKHFQLVLSDGSTIHLNSGSKIKYPIKFIKGQSREVFLDGEAYFKVSEDKEHVFVVQANDISTSVYGTEFNVSSYQKDDIHKVVLVKGSIGVHINGSGSESNNVPEELLLKPNEMASLSSNGQIIEKEVVDVAGHIVWRDGVLLFNNERLENILRKLERHYNVSIENNYSAIRDNQYTGTFDIETIEEILRSFSKHRPFTYIIEGNKISINP